MPRVGHKPDLGQPNADLSDSPFTLANLQKTDSVMRNGATRKAIELQKMNELELLNLRQEIDLLLPNKILSDLDMEEELMAQYMLAKLLQNNVHQDTNKGTTDKEKGQLLRMATTTLESLIRLQNSVYTSERIKHVESALAAAFEEAPLGVKTKFFNQYEMLIKEDASRKKV